MNFKQLNEKLQTYILNEAKLVNSLDKEIKSKNFNKYSDDELADEFFADIDLQDDLYIIKDDLFQTEGTDLLKTINDSIREHKDLEEIAEEWDEFDDVIWQYIPANKEYPYGRLFFNYVIKE